MPVKCAYVCTSKGIRRNQLCMCEDVVFVVLLFDFVVKY